jgi:type II secretory pathway component GspD/PulD (secretin)
MRHGWNRSRRRPGHRRDGAPASMPAVLLMAAALGVPAALAPAAWGQGPPPAETRRALERFAPVTLAVQEVDVKEILGLLAQSREINIVCESDVGGPITVQLHEVPFEEALQAIVAMAGFEVVHKGNIYYVHSAGDSDPAISIGRSLRTFRLDYAQPEDIRGMIEEFLSPIGRTTAYEPLRTVVVEDLPQVLDRVGQMVLLLDQAPRQVLIEAKILEAHLGRDASFGIDWSLLFSQEGGSGAVDVQGFANSAEAGLAGTHIAWGKGDFAAALESMAGIDNLNTLASPRVMAVDGHTARIQIGGQLGFTVRTIVDNTVIESVQFLDTGAQLEITPIITSDGFVQMRIHPELSDGVIQQGLPSKTTTQVSSNVLVRDGETVFIGGLIREREETVRQGIPLLMDIPLLGIFFGHTKVARQKSEVVVLLTPHILEPGQGYAYEPRHFSAPRQALIRQHLDPDGAAAREGDTPQEPDETARSDRRTTEHEPSWWDGCDTD